MESSTHVRTQTNTFFGFIEVEVILVTIENSLTSTNQAYKDVIDTNFHSHVLNPLKASSIL